MQDYRLDEREAPECHSSAIDDRVGPEVAAIGAAERDGAAVAVDTPGFAGNLAVADKGAQVFGGSPSGGPSVGARLARLGRVDPP